ncbi:MAG: hypothetical protein JWN33_315 [Candidatus Saccharibacteria bacterium]|nr:hypothetical protein [Candidatus Saccharibacteria bacterium]
MEPEEEPIVVRHPADVRREQNAHTVDFVAQAAQKLEEAAQKVAKDLIDKAARNQIVAYNNEFSARIAVRWQRANGVRPEPLKDRVEALLRERLGDDVDLIVMLYDEQSSYGGNEEACDITIWARPRSN